MIQFVFIKMQANQLRIAAKLVRIIGVNEPITGLLK